MNRKTIGAHVACRCHQCIEDFAIVYKITEELQLPWSAIHMILCPECGNKRCPKASNHRFACTGSNEPGQKGSIYAEMPDVEVDESQWPKI